MALNRSDKSRVLRRYFPGMTRNSEMSTEPSYPAILDDDVKKTLIPIPSLVEQMKIVSDLADGLQRLDQTISGANEQWYRTLDEAKAKLTKSKPPRANLGKRPKRSIPGTSHSGEINKDSTERLIDGTDSLILKLPLFPK